MKNALITAVTPQLIMINIADIITILLNPSNASFASFEEANTGTINPIAIILTPPKSKLMRLAQTSTL